MTNPSGYNVPNVQKPNGDWEINGNLDIASGGALKVAGTDITTGLLELLDVNDLTSFTNSTIAVAAEAADAVAVTITLKDAANAAVDEARRVRCWLSSSATTGALATDDGITVTATTGLLLKEDTDDLIFQAMTSTAGVLVLSIADADTAGPHYLWVEFPNGKCKVSAAIALAA